MQPRTRARFAASTSEDSELWKLVDFRRKDYRREERNRRVGAPPRRRKHETAAKTVEAPSVIQHPLVEVASFISNEVSEPKEIIDEEIVKLASVDETVSQSLQLEPVIEASSIQEIVSSLSSSSSSSSTSSPPRAPKDVSSTLPRVSRFDNLAENLSSSSSLSLFSSSLFSSSIVLPKRFIDVQPHTTSTSYSAFFTPLTSCDYSTRRTSVNPPLQKKLRRSERTGWLHLLNPENKELDDPRVGHRSGGGGGGRSDDLNDEEDQRMKNEDETGPTHASPSRTTSSVLLPRTVLFQSPAIVSSSSSSSLPSSSSSSLAEATLPIPLPSAPSTLVPSLSLASNHEHLLVDSDIEPTSLLGVEEAPSACIICCDDFVSEEGVEKETVEMECCGGIICLSCICKVVQLRSNRKTCALCQAPLSEEVMSEILFRKKQEKVEKREARRLMLISINEGTEDILAARRVAEVMANVGK
jgi:hypothetical protein